MSNVTGTNNQINVDAGSYNSNAQAVQSQIMSVQAQVQGLTLDIQSLIAELQALQPPQDPGPKASKDAQASYKQALQQYNQQVASLNSQLRGVQQRIGEAQQKLGMLQNAKLPAAEQRDRQEMEQHLEQERKRLETTVKSAATENTDALQSSNSHVELRVMVRKQEIKTGEIKSMVNMFQLVLTQMGSSDNSAIQPTSTPGTGLPPAGTP